MAKELGAIVESNLTDTATHLVASDFASEKYKVRRRHRRPSRRHARLFPYMLTYVAIIFR